MLGDASSIRRMWSFSKALDLALVDEEIEKGLQQPFGHQHGERVAYIALALGKGLGFPKEELTSLMIAGLLHDIGAVGGFRQYHGDYRLMREHCLVGSAIVRRFPDGENLSRVIQYHHETPDLSHSALRTDPEEVPLMSRILALADKIDVHLSRHTMNRAEKENLIQWVKEHEGKLFFPEVIPPLLELARKEAFWIDLEQPDLMQIAFVLLGEPEYPPVPTVWDQQVTQDLAGIFADLIDQKSAFTARHSRAVADTAEKLARTFGWEEKRLNDIRVAGLLHDLGKLSIPKRILDKPGQLDVEEVDVIRTHTYYTYRLLREAGFPQHVVNWAAYHHERLDGTGYPFALKAAALDTGARLMTIADIYAALTEDRPYRKALTPGEALAILEKGVGKQVDPELIIVARKALI